MVKAALIGFGLSLLLLAIPIVHFVTGPIGPFVGGFVGGTKARATPGQAAGIGLLMGLFMAGPAIVLVLVGLLAEGLVSSTLRTVLEVLAVVLVVYTGLLGTLGALVGGHRASLSQAKE